MGIFRTIENEDKHIHILLKITNLALIANWSPFQSNTNSINDWTDRSYLHIVKNVQRGLM